ncbi:hypothetical protein Csa_014780 [Cucumis sativus]|uniref:Uncharacterized protein n=1 Tax=Cucumis sativus TaxID=3659 RepID=A0A0A0KYC9_CUCSA|nr:hypothetical protein Csa_014780 [Cucumis sativus]
MEVINGPIGSIQNEEARPNTFTWVAALDLSGSGLVKAKWPSEKFLKKRYSRRSLPTNYLLDPSSSLLHHLRRRWLLPADKASPTFLPTHASS